MLLNRSAVALRLANALTDRKEVRDRLRAAVDFARDASDLDATQPLAWDALGCALEDRSFLLNEPDGWRNVVVYGNCVIRGSKPGRSP